LVAGARGHRGAPGDVPDRLDDRWSVGILETTPFTWQASALAVARQELMARDCVSRPLHAQSPPTKRDSPIWS
jgi:hypothetical protein